MLVRMSVAQNIRLRRLELGMSQDELAAVLGYKSRSSVAKIESGDNDIPLSKLLEIARALDIDAAELLSGASGRPSAPAQIERVGKEGSRRVAAIVLAGGKSTRNLQNIPNQFMNVLGKPIISYCLDVYQRHPLVNDIFVVCTEGWEAVIDAYTGRFGVGKMRGVVQAGASGVRSILGGVERVRAEGYRSDDLVVLQESTRPFVTDEMVTAVLVAGSKDGSAITGERMVDNVQFVVSDDETAYVDRDRIVDLQSPDAYTIDFLDELFERANRERDGLMQSCMGLLMSDLGYRLNFCLGFRGNMKIVRQEDIAVFTALAKQRL